MPGRLRTASRPSSTVIAEASYSKASSTAVEERFSATASAIASAAEGGASGPGACESVVGSVVNSSFSSLKAQPSSRRLQGRST